MLAQFTTGKRVLVTPGMIELGVLHQQKNEEFGLLAAGACDYVFLVGPEQTRPIAEGLRRGGHERSAVQVEDLAEMQRRLKEFGEALAGVEGDFLVVASTDLNHFEDQGTTIEKDRAVIRAIERLDGEALREAILSRDVSMCGYAPVLAAMAFAKARGCPAARTVLHLTSGDVTGDFDRVVGYVGMIMPCGSSSGRTPAGN